MALMAGKDSSGIPRSAIIDDITRFMVTIQADEHRIHLGKQFYAQYVQEVTDTGNISAMVFNTPSVLSGKFVHAIVEGKSTDQVEFRFIEEPSVDEAEASSVITPLNRYRGHSRTSLLSNAEPVKAGSGNILWTGVAQELDSFSIGADVYLITALEATATAANPDAFWIALGDAQAATMDGVAITAIDAAQATSNNAPATVEASQGSGTSVDLDADLFGDNGNLAVTIIVGANMSATSLSAGVGGLVQEDGEYPGLINSISAYDLTNAAGANITQTNSLINEIIGQGAATPAKDSQAGLARGEREWILKPGTQYCIYMESLNANDNTHNIDMHWYEVEHKDPTSSF
jgi:hypothetical protein